MACGHSLLYVFKVRGVSTELVGALTELVGALETSAPPESVSTELVDFVGMAGMPYPPTSQSCLHASHDDRPRTES